MTGDFYDWYKHKFAWSGFQKGIKLNISCFGLNHAAHKINHRNRHEPT